MIDPLGPRSVLAALALLATTAFLIGCGIEGQPFGKDREDNDESSKLVTEERIADKDPGSPPATALSWWRGIQTRNPQAVRAAYTPKVRENLPADFDAAVLAALTPAAVESWIGIDSFEEQSERRGTLFLTIDSSNETMNGPLSLPMTEVQGEWLISSSSFIRTLPGVLELGEALKEARSASNSSKETDPPKLEDSDDSSGG